MKPSRQRAVRYVCILMLPLLQCSYLSDKVPGSGKLLSGVTSKLPTSAQGLSGLSGRVPGLSLVGGVPNSLNGVLPSGAAALLQKGDLQQLALKLGVEAAVFVAAELVIAVSGPIAQWRHERAQREAHRRLVAADLDCRELGTDAQPKAASGEGGGPAASVLDMVRQVSIQLADGPRALGMLDAELKRMSGRQLDIKDLLARGRLRDTSVRLRIPAGPVDDLLKEAEGALADRRQALGKDDAEVAHSLNTLAQLYLRKLDYKKAGALLDEALSLRKRWLKDNHLCLAQSYFALGEWNRQQYQATSFRAAEQHYTAALRIRQHVLGMGHPDTALVLVSLGELYRDHGLYNQAEQKLLEAEQSYLASVKQGRLASYHPSVSELYLRLGRVRQDMGAYDLALKAYGKALQLRQIHATMHQEDLDAELGISEALAARAGLYQVMGDQDGAVQQYELALDQQARRVIDRGHPGQKASQQLNDDQLRVAQLRCELAEALMQRNQPNDADNAIKHLTEAVAAQQKALGKDHPDVGRTLARVGHFHAQYGNPAEAERYWLQALHILESHLEREHPEVATIWLQLGRLRHDRGDIEGAEKFFQAALASRQAKLSDSHPETAFARTLLASTWLAQKGREQAALAALTNAFITSDEALNGIGATTDESRITGFLEKLRLQEDIIYSFAVAPSASAPVQQLAVRALLLRKGRAIDEVAHTMHTLHAEVAAASPKAQEWLREWHAERARRADLGLSGAPDLSAKTRESMVRNMRSKEEQLVSALPKLKERELPPPDRILEEVIANLGLDEVLADIVRYQRFRFDREPGKPRFAEPRYLAALLRRNGQVRVIDLGEASAIDGAADGYQQQVKQLEEVLTDTTASGPAKQAALDAARLPMQEALARLGALVIEPLRPFLGKGQGLILSPDGKLLLVPLHAAGVKVPLITERQVVYVTSGRDLLRRGRAGEVAHDVMVLAGPDYDHLPPGWAKEPEKRGAPLGITFPPLSGALAEGNLLQQRLPQAQVLTGIEATRERLLAMHQPGILHVATHGVFLPAGITVQVTAAATPPGQAETRAPRLTVAPSPGSSDSPGGTGKPLRRVPADPMLRSFLALAGANQGGGTVTALEVAGMDLWGTQLVVLSACQSGVGDINHPGQGVYGLRRAVMIAGAQTLVTTLWRVSDHETQRLMGEFYDALLEKVPRGEALQRAVLKLRKLKGHPYFWAPFIMVGDNRPLAGIEPDAPQLL